MIGFNPLNSFSQNLKVCGLTEHNSETSLMEKYFLSENKRAIRRYARSNAESSPAMTKRLFQRSDGHILVHKNRTGKQIPFKMSSSVVGAINPRFADCPIAGDMREGEARSVYRVRCEGVGGVEILGREVIGREVLGRY